MITYLIVNLFETKRKKKLAMELRNVIMLGISEIYYKRINYI